MVCGSGRLDQRRSFSRIIPVLCPNSSMKPLHLQQWCLLLRTPVPPVVFYTIAINWFNQHERPNGQQLYQYYPPFVLLWGAKNQRRHFWFPRAPMKCIIKKYRWGGVKWEWQGCSGGGVWCLRCAPLLWDVFCMLISLRWLQKGDWRNGWSCCELWI